MANKEYDQILQQYEEAKVKYTEESSKVNYIVTQACNNFNSIMSLINVERHLMRNEITRLYKFLKQFGNIGEKITPFDFVMEDWHTVKYNAGVASKGYYDQKNSLGSKSLDELLAVGATAGVMGAATSVMGTASVGSLVGMTSVGGSLAGIAGMGAIMPIALPVALPAYLIFKGLGNSKNEKEQIIKFTEKFNKEKAAWAKNVEDGIEEINFLNMAISIANIYRVLITTVKDAISETIVPEINSINAFLYADAIKNCIINNEDPNDVVITNIREFVGTPYEPHYLFIRNTFDYYQLITKFFTEPILTNILNDHKITKEEYDNFIYEVEKIKDKQESLKKETVFGGEENVSDIR